MACVGPDENDQRLVAAGLTWTPGSSGAMIDDTLPLLAHYINSAGDPIGLPVPRISWSSSDSTVLHILNDTVALARNTGAVLIQGQTRTPPSFELSVRLEVIPRLVGRMVWIRQPQRDSQFTALMVQDFPSSQPRTLPTVGRPSQSKGNPAITADARMVALQSERVDRLQHALFIVDLETGTNRIILDSLPGHQFYPQWLPGDTLLAFLCCDAFGTQVFTVHPDGSGLLQRTFFSPRRPPFFDTTPDGNLVLDIGADLYETTLSGAIVRRLTSTATAQEGSPAVSPDGSLIAYGRTDDAEQATHVWTMNRDGSNQRRLFDRVRSLGGSETNTPPWHTEPAQSFEPEWTADGRFLVLTWCIDPYLRPYLQPSVGEYYDHPCQIYLVRVSDALAIRLTRTTTVEVQPVIR